MTIPFIISLSINILGFAAFIIKRRYYKKSGTTGYADFINQVLTDQHNHLPIQPDDIVFVGTSLTAGFPLTEMFGDLRIKNRGIGSNLTSHVLGRIEPIARGKPMGIFLECGINDLEAGISAESILADVMAIVNKIIAISPQTSIVIQSLLPTSGTYERLNEKARALNNDLKMYCQMNGVEYVDLYSSLVEGGKLGQQYTSDGIHLNFKAYEVWARLIKHY